MKKTIILTFILILLASLIEAYEWNENGYKLDADFANGGVQEQQGNYNVTHILGFAELRPFNESGIYYRVNQGLLYLVWSDIQIIDIVAFNITCSILHKEIEWGEINCTTTTTNITWAFSILNNLTNESYIILDTRTEGTRKFVGLQEGIKYKININATKSGAIESTSTGFLTKLGGEKYMAYAVIGLVMMGITFLIGIFALKSKNSIAQISLTLLTILMIASDFFITSRIINAVDPTQLMLIGQMEKFYSIAIQVLKLGIWVMAFFTLYLIYKFWKSLPSQRKRRMEEKYLNE